MSRLRAAGLLGLLLAGSACAAPPEPSVLAAARSRLEGPDADALSDLQPRLLREARIHRARAMKAFERKDVEAARLHGHLVPRNRNDYQKFRSRDLT